MAEIGYILLGLAAGILSGLFGIGGGIVLVPSLIVFFGLEILDANATSLAAMLLPVGVLGVWSYYKAGLVNVRESLWISLGLFAGSFFGGEIAVNISEKLLSTLYSLILIYVAVSYLDLPSLLKKIKKKKDAEVVVKKHSVWAFIAVGMAAGVFAGLFGKGGGIVIVPMLIAAFHYAPKMAVATSLAALQLPVGLPGVLVYAEAGHLNLLPSALIAAGIVAGALVGSVIGVRLPSDFFKKVYAFFLLVVAVYMVVK
ncbi:MAG: sulfite exporter TauE/SafE family protein [Paludibacter sp.]|jgi:uncharacterized membrane protein YfcA|nr:sulfite exporter TauE/SafE family protein [Paludibacter sp.]